VRAERGSSRFDSPRSKARPMLTAMVSFVHRVFERVQLARLAACGAGALALLSTSAVDARAQGHYAQQDKDRRLVVVELFTSQGCSSCPPADRLQAELATRNDVLALTFPVDYWDYLGWRDTLATPANSERQVEYAQRSQSGRVFTPQMIVDGRGSVVGSRRQDVLSEITKERSDAQTTVPLSIEVKDGKVFVSVPNAHDALKGAETHSATLWLFPFSKTDIVQIAGGENRGRSMIYAHVVHDQIGLGQWSGEAATFEHTLSGNDRDTFGYAAILQDDKVGPVIGAAWAADTDRMQPAPMAPEPTVAADPLVADLPR
jgi:hypothetical protein